MSEERELWKQRYFMDNYGISGEELVQTLTDKSGESDEALAAVNWAIEESGKNASRCRDEDSTRGELFSTSVSAFAAGVIWADKKLTFEVIGPLKDKVLYLNEMIRLTARSMKVKE